VRIRHSVCCLIAGALAGLLAAAPNASAQGLGRRFDFAELKQMVDDAGLLVRGKALAEPVSKGAGEEGLAWRIPFEILEVVKGQQEARTLDVYVESPFRDLNCARKQIPGKEYVLPLVPLAEDEQGGFRLVHEVGFAAGSPEADKLIEIAKGKVTSQTVIPLRLRLSATGAPYESGKPAPVQAVLENLSDEAITYAQAPLDIRYPDLYLIGEGDLVVSDGRGNAVPRKEALHVGVDPPPPALPVVIAPKGKFERELDLTTYTDLGRPGVYRVTLALAGPDGKEVLRSNTVGMQIIPPLSAPVEPVEPIAPTSADALRIPSPGAYQPGKTENGLAGLLRPVSAEFEVGQPINLELRLINRSDRTMEVDTRLERMLLVEVQEQGDSPGARPLLQHHDWPADADDAKAYRYAHLRPAAFWGKLINVNSLYGRDAASLMAGGSAAISGAVEPAYETHGMTLFSFDKPGVYKIRATYQVKPRGGTGPRVWAGKLATNPVFVRVVPQGATPPPPTAPEE